MPGRLTHQVSGVVNDAKSAARTAGESRVVEAGARAGYAASGVMHLLMGWLALQIAVANYHGAADQSGAFRMLAGTTLGLVLLWALTIGFGLLGLWNLFETVQVREWGDRLKCTGKGITYLALAFSAAGFARHHGTASASQTEKTTRSVLASPGGAILVGILGLAVVGVGAYHVIKGIRKKFLQDLVTNPGRAGQIAGQVGYALKGLALGIVGVIFLHAAWDHDANQARGLDGALKAILTVPLGRVLLVVVALGFVAYGVYSFFRAKDARV